jgi:hypothetical protein
MANNRSKGGLVGVAVGLVATATQSVRPEFFGNHPWILPATLLFLFASIVLWLAQYAWFRKLLGIPSCPEDDPPNNSGIYAGRDISGKAIQSVGNYYEAAQAPPPAPQKPRPKANLVSLGSRSIEPGVNYLYDTFVGDSIRTLRVENRIPGAIIPGAVATLRFSQDGVELATVSTAYWYSKTTYEIDFELNEIQEVVLGKCSKGRWFFYVNKQRHISEWGRRPDREADKPDSFKLERDVMMTIQIFNPYRQEEPPLLEETYVISPDKENCTVKKV